MSDPSPANADPLVETIVREGPLGLSATARLCGTFRGGRPVHPATVGRWCLHGAPAPNGRTVRLEHIRMPGGKLATSRPALHRFLSALQAADPTPAPPPARSPAARTRASEAADAELRRHGC